MKFNELTTSTYRTKQPTRVGRGISAGKGKTAGRGTKGQGSRKSGGVRPGFEGGQMPLYMRIPKLRGFKSKRVKASEVYTGDLNNLKQAVDNQTLYEAGLLPSPYVVAKLVVKGELTSKKTVKLQGASAAAIAMIESAGGSFERVDQIGRPAKKTTATDA